MKPHEAACTRTDALVTFFGMAGRGHVEEFRGFRIWSGPCNSTESAWITWEFNGCIPEFLPEFHGASWVQVGIESCRRDLGSHVFPLPESSVCCSHEPATMSEGFMKAFRASEAAYSPYMTLGLKSVRHVGFWNKV